jgi:ABC-type uncharacterized transport system substrate-binding protein
MHSTCPGRGAAQAKRSDAPQNRDRHERAAYWVVPALRSSVKNAASRPGHVLKRSALALTVLLAALFGAPTAHAHPHVWVTAASELIYAADGSISGVRHAWTFDDMFSTYALQGMESKTKGVFTREELAPLAQTNVESLKEFGFFTFAKADGKKEKFLEPVDYFLEQKDGALVLHFTLPFKTPFKTKQLALEVYDPSFFVDFALAKQDPIRLVGAPASCSFAIQRPNDGAAGAQKLNEQTFMNGENSNYGAMFANKITVDCP